MSSDKFQNKYRIDSARAKWHDYDDGFYFVTICTKNRECFFGTIENNEIIFSEIGKYTYQQLKLFSEHSEYIEMLKSVIMPNHIHMILAIDKANLPHKKRDIPILQKIPETNDAHESVTDKATKQQSWLSVVIRLFKQSVTRFADHNGIRFGWQERFHDHIIRNQKEMDFIVEYIENNIQRWDEDSLRNPVL